MTEPQQDSPELENSDQETPKSEQKNKRTNSKPRQPKNKSRARKGSSGRDSEKKTESGGFNRDSKGFKLSPDSLVRHFLGCRICCYFLTGTQVIYGRDVVDRMVDEFDGKWFSIPLGYETRKLMQQTYGLRLDQQEQYVDFSCEVCCRRFTIEIPENEPVAVEEAVLTKTDDEGAESRIEVEIEAVPARRTIEQNVQEWNEGNLPMMRVEFKHRR